MCRRPHIKIETLCIVDIPLIKALNCWSLIFCLIDSKADPSSVDQKKRPAVGKQEVSTHISCLNIGFEIN